MNSKKIYKNKLRLAQFSHRLPICFSFVSLLILSVKFCLIFLSRCDLYPNRYFYFVRRGVIFISWNGETWTEWESISIDWDILRKIYILITQHFSVILFIFIPTLRRPRVTGYSSVGAQIRHLAHGEGVTHLNSKLSYS